MKKIIIYLLTLCLLVGCNQQKPEPTTSFETFIENTTDFFLEGTTSFNLNFLMNYPENDGEYFGLGFATEEDYIATMEGYENILQELRLYDKSELSETHQIVYTALEDYLERQLVMKDYYYYDNDYFGSYSSVVQELPLLLEMYSFCDENDLEYYFLNIKEFKNDFLKAIEFEKARQEKGLGFSQKILDDTIEQIEGIIEEGGQETIKNVNENIDELDFITDEQKEDYKQRNKTAIEEDFMGAYQALLDGLKTIEGKEENVSIHDKDYYEAVVFNQLGTKKDIRDIEDELDDLYDDSYKTLIKIASMNEDLLATDNFYDIPYTEFSDARSGLDYLKENIYELVPEIGNLEYDIYTVPESLQDGFAPAAYLTPRVDMEEDQKECIMINPSSPSENLFPTLVHEGYPGHMYQGTYLRQKEYPTIMYLLDCIGYTEGWAIYMENRASEFLETNINWQKLVIANDAISSSLLGTIDIGIHYKGWDYQDCVDYFNDQFGSNYTDELQDLYDIILQTPGYYLYYIYSGEYLHELYEEATDELGKIFNEVEFHKAILDSGAVGLDVVKENVNKFIKANQ